MEPVVKSLIIIALAAGVIYFYYNVYDGTNTHFSKLNNKVYKVRSSHNKELKADLLATLDEKLKVLVESLRSIPNPPESIKRLIINWDSGISIKEIGNMESDAAYVINKKYMSFCLKDFNNVSLETINLLTYVGIHELSHVMSVETGHGEEFKQNFKFLLDYSKNLKYYDQLLKKEVPLYIPLNKLKTPSDYCGVSIINSIN